MTALNRTEKGRQSSEESQCAPDLFTAHPTHPTSQHNEVLLQISSDSLPFSSSDKAICKFRKSELKSHKLKVIGLLTSDYQLRKSINTPSWTNSGLIGEMIQNLKNFLLPDSSLFASSLHIPLLVMTFQGAFILYCLNNIGLLMLLRSLTGRTLIRHEANLESVLQSRPITGSSVLGDSLQTCIYLPTFMSTCLFLLYIKAET